MFTRWTLCFVFTLAWGMNMCAEVEDSQASHKSPPLAPGRFETGALAAADANSSFVQFLRQNGRIPKTPAEWEQDLKKLGGVVRHSQFAFSTSPATTGLLRRRIIFTVDPTERTAASMPLRHTMAVAGVLQPDGSLGQIEFISPKNTRSVSEPEFGVLQSGVPYHADTNVCYSCHKNHAFIFPPERTDDPDITPWMNTLINPHNITALYAKLAQKDSKKYGPIHSELAELSKNGSASFNRRVDQLKLDGLRVHDDAIEVCNSMAAADMLIQMQGWLKAIPNRQGRSELLHDTLLDALTFRARNNNLLSYPASAEVTGKTNPYLRAGQRAQRTAKKLWRYAEDLPIRKPMSVNPPHLPKTEAELLLLDKEMVKNRDATLRKLLPYLPSSPKGFVFGPNLFESGGNLLHDGLSQDDDQRLYQPIRDSLAKIPGTQREEVLYSALDAALNNPYFKPYYDEGAVPDRIALLTGLGIGLKRYFSEKHGIVEARFDHLVTAEPGLAQMSQVRPQAVLSAAGKCAACHQAATASRSLRFSLDPTDPKTREDALRRLSPNAARHFIQRYWVRAVLEQSMPPEEQGGLTEAELADLTAFLQKKASELQIRLRGE